MTVAYTTPVTGGAQTGLTAPTYTLTSDTAPDVNAKQFAITALGGTQTGVITSSIAAPFTLSFWKPKIFKFLGKPNPTTGLITSIPRNVFKQVTRKGVLPLVGQPYQEMVITTVIEVPAGADIADPANIRAALSLHIGGLNQQSAGIGDSSVTGVI